MAVIEDVIFVESDKYKKRKYKKLKDGRVRVTLTVQNEVSFDSNGNIKKKQIQKQFYGSGKSAEAEAKLKLQEYIQERINKQENKALSEEQFIYSFENWVYSSKITKVVDESFDRLEDVYLNQIKPHIYLFSSIKTKDILTEDIEKLITVLIEKGYSLSTIKKVVSLLDNFFSRMIMERKIIFNPVDREMLIPTEKAFKSKQRTINEKRNKLIEKLFDNYNLTKEEFKMFASYFNITYSDDDLKLYKDKVKGRKEMKQEEFKKHCNNVEHCIIPNDSELKEISSVVGFKLDKVTYHLLLKKISINDSQVFSFSDDDITTFKWFLKNGYAPSRAKDKNNCKRIQFTQPEAFDFLLNTGLRAGELLALKYSDVDFENSSISITKAITTRSKRGTDGRTLGSQESIISEPKTESSIGTIYISDYALNVLKEMKKKESDDYNGFIVYNSKGGEKTHLTYSGLRKRFTNIINQAELSHRGLHSLRHTFATKLNAYPEADFEIIQIGLRHSRKRSVTEGYIDKNIERYKKVIKDFMI